MGQETGQEKSQKALHPLRCPGLGSSRLWGPLPGRSNTNVPPGRRSVRRERRDSVGGSVPKASQASLVPFHYSRGCSGCQMLKSWEEFIDDSKKRTRR